LRLAGAALAFGGRIDFGSLVIKFDCDGESHSFVNSSGRGLCKFCASCHRILIFIHCCPV